MKTKLSLLSLVILFFVTSCKKEKGSYPIPATYSFNNVDYSGQTARLAMMTELSNEMKKANTSGVALSATLLKDMYANTNSPFSDAALNTSGKKLKDKTFLAEQAMIEAYIDSIVLHSQSVTAGSNGVAGVVTSGTKAYLCGPSGIEYGQYIDKGLLGSLIYYQITAVYLSEDKIGKQIPVADREHHWDEAFGYFGVPVDFPSNTSGLKYIGKYCNDRNALLGLNANIMNAYLKGRAAISNNDHETVTQQIVILRENLEKVLAATAIKYINDAINNASDDAVRNHALSEGVAFVQGLRYNPAKKISDAQINQIVGLFGTNFYTISITNLQSAKDLLSSIYGFDSVKNQL